MKAKGEIEALKTLTDFRKQAFSNAPRAGLRLGPPTALSCLPVVQRKVGKEFVPHTRGSVSGEPGPSCPVGDARQKRPPVRGGAPRGVPGVGAGMIPACRTRLTPPCPLPVSLQHCDASAPESALHYANGKTFRWSRMEVCAWFPWDLPSNCSKPT